MSKRLRVATFNVHHCEGLDGLVDIARTARVIAATGAQLVALQELDRHLPRSGSIDQPVALATAGGMSVAFHPTLERARGEYGIGIATEEPVEASFAFLPRAGDEEPRGWLTVAYEGVSVIVTHLSRDAHARAMQIEALASAAAAVRAPVLVLGDLNATHGALGPLEAVGLRACTGTPTMPARHPRRQIDHVLAGGGLSVTKCWTIPTDASDHRPLVADLELP